MKERITVFDIELLNSDPTSLCSIGIVLLEDLKVIDSYHSLIKPKHMRFERERYHIHHIQPKALIKQPTFKDIWKDIQHFFDHTIVVSHDIQLDMMHIRNVCRQYKIPYPDIEMSCTNVLTHLLYPDLEKYNLDYLCQLFHISFERKHHSYEDALACADLLRYLLKEKNTDSLRELHQRYLLDFGIMKENYYKNIVSPNLVNKNQEPIHPYSNQSFAFTGVLKTKDEILHQQLEDIRAYFSKDVNTQTRILVVGNVGYLATMTSTNNKKLNKARYLIEMGQDLKIISETDYLKLVKI